MNLKDINPASTSNRMNSLISSRFGFTIDFDRLSWQKAQQLNALIGENIQRIRRAHGVHQVERNPKYMELLMVRESLGRWMQENQQLMESEMGKSQAILAAKDMVDSLQDMLEKVSKMQVEQLPALIDTIRDQIGMAEADQFKSSMSDLLQNVSQSLSQARETADNSARSLAGEGGNTMPGADLGAAGMPIAPVAGEPSDLDTDEFNATDAAVGGSEPMGREKR